MSTTTTMNFRSDSWVRAWWKWRVQKSERQQNWDMLVLTVNRVWEMTSKWRWYFSVCVWMHKYQLFYRYFCCFILWFMFLWLFVLCKRLRPDKNYLQIILINIYTNPTNFLFLKHIAYNNNISWHKNKTDIFNRILTSFWISICLLSNC